MKQISRLPDAELEVMQACGLSQSIRPAPAILRLGWTGTGKRPPCSSSCPGWRSGALSGGRRRDGPTATPLW